MSDWRLVIQHRANAVVIRSRVSARPLWELAQGAARLFTDSGETSSWAQHIYLFEDEMDALCEWWLKHKQG